ncbi:FimB/Mfa2 family fimbrial subunit, partial [Candidatus Saccharibacteria bacterium]|nr:FimB/Mfa2 family fimbrial subunit [Candidatus Saccharibacteria bacterium]
MKKFSFFAGMILLAASCSNDRVESVDNVQVENVVAPVTVSVSGFSITQEGFSGTRSTAVADYADVKALTVAFYKVDDGSEVYKNTQFRDNLPEGETFGAFSTTLSAGNYTMVVLGYGQGQPNQAITMTSATAATYGEGTVYDTFAATQEVSITNSDAKNLTATLQRIVTALAV